MCIILGFILICKDFLENPHPPLRCKRFGHPLPKVEGICYNYFMQKRYYTQNALSNAKKLRKTQTDVENILWYHLRNSNLNGIKFRRQVPIGDYIVDFLCMNKKLVVELDGSQHIDNIEYDTKRTSFLEQKGYKVIRIFNNEILENLPVVLEYIYQTYIAL